MQWGYLRRRGWWWTGGHATEAMAMAEQMASRIVRLAGVSRRRKVWPERIAEPRDAADSKKLYINLLWEQGLKRLNFF